MYPELASNQAVSHVPSARENARFELPESKELIAVTILSGSLVGLRARVIPCIRPDAKSLVQLDGLAAGILVEIDAALLRSEVSQ